MRLASLRPQYFFARLREINFCRRHPEAPWLGESAVLFLEAWLKATDVGVEWGSGRSTLWIASRVRRLTSVEHDPEYYEKVTRQLAARNLTSKVDYRHVPCLLDEFDEPATHPYGDVATQFPDDSLDFALIDAMLRGTCMRAVLPKIKPGGLLILDNANRYLPNPSLGGYATVHEARSQPRTPAWVSLARELEGWRQGLLTDRIWDTRIWVRPCR